MNIKKGIGLIVLVITIIVMIVLAATIIISLTNNGIVDNANKAVEDTELANAKVLAETAWADAYAAGNRTQGTLKTAVKNALESNKFDLDRYTVTVTDKGVTVEKAVSGGWTLEKTKTGSKVTSVKVKKGSQSIDVGTVVNYTAPLAKGYSGTWKILGVDESGRIKLMSTESIGDINIAFSPGYKVATTELNTKCDGYADGLKAEDSRSVKVEDIDELTGYDKTTYGANELYQYGNVVTFYWDGTDYPAYTATNGKSGSLSSAYSSDFRYYDEATKDFVINQKKTSGEITNLTSTYYSYGCSKYLDNTTPAYKMIFRNAEDTSNAPIYWIASTCVFIGSDYVKFGVMTVYHASVTYMELASSKGDTCGRSYGCRAVVTLKPEISLVANGETGTYNIV